MELENELAKKCHKDIKDYLIREAALSHLCLQTCTYCMPKLQYNMDRNKKHHTHWMLSSHVHKCAQRHRGDESKNYL